MEPTLPITIQPLIDAYLRGLEPLQSHFPGISITDSLAPGAFEEQARDIDVIVLTQGERSSLELKHLKMLHTHLLKTSAGLLCPSPLSWQNASCQTDRCR